jgi:hypothetical protein
MTYYALELYALPDRAYRDLDKLLLLLKLRASDLMYASVSKSMRRNVCMWG